MSLGVDVLLDQVLLASLETGPDQFDVDVCDFRRIDVSLWWPSPNLRDLVHRFECREIPVHHQSFVEPPTKDSVEGFDFPLVSRNCYGFVVGLMV